ncbi:MAG: hypothetical protein P1P84_18125 [Deferrisomatales bacterium]|nr:hypothetical protein [Deferrisomatales bacterium]
MGCPTRWLFAAALVLAGWALAPAPARAAFDPFDWAAKPGDSRSYESVTRRFEDLLQVYDYPAVFRALQQDARASSAWRGDETTHRHLLQALEVLNGRFATFARYRDAGSGGAPDLDRLLDDIPTGLFQCVDERCFSGTPFEVTYEELAGLPAAQGEDFLYRVDSVHRLLWNLKQPAIRASVQGIRRARQRWDRFVEQGMAQYPWEAVGNDLLAPEGSIEFPPQRQWIFLHPQLGVEVSTDGLNDLRVKESLLVEVVGHVWYRWQDTDPAAGLRWWGVSGALSLRDDLRPGIGVVGHYGKLVTLGVLWHDRDEDDNWFDQAPHLVFGVDLFRLVEDRAPAYQEAWRNALGGSHEARAHR